MGAEAYGGPLSVDMWPYSCFIHFCHYVGEIYYKLSKEIIMFYVTGTLHGSLLDIIKIDEKQWRARYFGNKILQNTMRPHEPQIEYDGSCKNEDNSRADRIMVNVDNIDMMLLLMKFWMQNHVSQGYVRISGPILIASLD